MGDILRDSRFTKYLNDPRYRQIPRHERKVKIDKRFQSMFQDAKFKVKYSVDKRGRPVNETSTENLRKYYELESDEASSTDDISQDKVGDKTDSADDEAPEEAVKFVKLRSNETDNEKLNLQQKNDKLVRGNLDDKIKEKLHDLDIDYARGEGILQTDSSSDGESSEPEDDSEYEHEWGELDADAETTDQSSRRIAVCNMDWDNIKAADIMVLFSSFLPPGGVILSVSVYPSQYGLKRMQEEEIRGPLELTEEKNAEYLSDDGGKEEGSTYHMEKLRRYQLNRLKYYYAVVECDSVETADKLYNDCDGMEYESSATKLDLRFVPEDETFDQEPREVCTKLPDLTKYQPRLFTTTALQQAKVELTWDSTNPNRTEIIKSALDGKIDDLGLKEYLASSTDDDLDDDNECDTGKIVNDKEEDPIQKYKNLLKDIQVKEEQKKNKNMEMEITWGLGLKEKADELVKKKVKEVDKTLTPFEKLVEKKKQKKKQMKLERKQQLTKKHDRSSDSETENSSDEVPSDIDMNDPYFAEEFNKPEFKNRKQIRPKKNKTNDNDDKSKAELELLLDEADGKSHFSLKKIQEAESSAKKFKRKTKLKQNIDRKVGDFEVNVNDKRFLALYNSHLFNIDPTDPNYKKTKNMEKLIHEKLKRRPTEDTKEVDVQSKKSREDAELSVLVKNIKRKTQKLINN